jgi:hypothetical protein
VRWLGTDEVVENRGKARRGVLPEGGSGGAWTNEREGSSFIATHCVGATRAYTRRERGRSRLGVAAERRECTRAAWHSSDVVVAAALCGGDVEGVCPYAVGKEVRWTGGGWWWPRGAHGRHSAWCLCGAGLGSWRLDGAARGASKEGGSRGAARGVVAGCLEPASRRFSSNDSDQPTQQDDAMPRRQCSLLAVRRRGSRRRDVTDSSQRLG